MKIKGIVQYIITVDIEVAQDEIERIKGGAEILKRGFQFLIKQQAGKNLNKDIYLNGKIIDCEIKELKEV